MEIYLFNFSLIFLLNIFGVLCVREIRLLLLLDLIFLATTCLFLIFINEEFRVQLLETYLLKQLVIFFWIISKNFSLKNVKYNLGVNFFVIISLLILILQAFYIFDDIIRLLAILILLVLLLKSTLFWKLKINHIFSLGFIWTIILIFSNFAYSLYSLDDAILITFSSLWYVSLFLIIYFLSMHLLFYKFLKPELIQVKNDLKNIIKFLVVYVLLVAFLQVAVHHNQFFLSQTAIISVVLSYLQIRIGFYLRQVLIEIYSPWL